MITGKRVATETCYTRVASHWLTHASELRKGKFSLEENREKERESEKMVDVDELISPNVDRDV